ncbi:hypothetical protein I3843_05G164700 [Carya illinoinensis]|nr:hypothetical protein I3843_05G164700 [Carya illinoinensis]
MGTSASPNLDDYSAASTVITFDLPLPLLRGPIHARLADDPTAGPYLLAFWDSQAWTSALQACQSKIFQQCESGARVGCSLAASDKCKPPWWRAVIDRKPTDLRERERCEEREMEGCFVRRMRSASGSRGTSVRLLSEMRGLPSGKGGRLRTTLGS